MNKKKYGHRFIFTIKHLFLFMLLFSVSVKGQEKELQEKVVEIQALLTTVEANKITYIQDLKTVSPGYYEYTVTEMNDKGNGEERIYSFGLSDITIKSINSHTKKDVIRIELSTTGKQKLIKKSANQGNKMVYVANFNMYGLNAENGRELEKTIKEAVPFADELEENTLLFTTYNEYVNWLKSNISSVDLQKKQIGQLFDVEASKVGYIALSTNDGPKEERVEFNLAWLNPNSVSYKISGDAFLVQAYTKKKIKGLKYFKDNDLKGYQDNVSFYANSVANGKNIYKVLKRIIPLAVTEFDTSKPDFQSIAVATKYINEHIANIATEEEMTTQQFVLKEGIASISTKEVKGNKSDEYEYGFNLADINKLGITCDSKKARLFLELNTHKGQNFIQHTKNGELENYIKTCSLYFNTMDEASIAEEALQFLIEAHEDKSNNKKEADLSLKEAVVLLKKEIKSLESNGDQFDQFIALLETETNTLKFTNVSTSAKISVETILEFSTNDLNVQGIHIEVSGKRVWAELNTKSLEKVVKVYEDGQVQNYRNKIEIEATCIENARKIVEIFKTITEQ